MTSIQRERDQLAEVSAKLINHRKFRGVDLSQDRLAPDGGTMPHESEGLISGRFD